MTPQYINTIVQLALAEDIGPGDITTDHVVPARTMARARLVAKSDGVVCGTRLAREVFRHLSSKILFRTFIQDGHPVCKNGVIAEITGPARALLTGERVALNFLSYLSAIATQTRRFVNQVKPYRTQILDTRKTTPLLRQAERYAVRCGGGINHRFNLNSMAMIKDNHRVIYQGLDMNHVVDALKKKIKTKIEVEVDNLIQFKDILRSKADIVLLDNMDPRQVARAVAMRRQAKSRVLLEASGGITLKNVRRYAAAGVDRISVGALTHSRQALDISMEFIFAP